MLLARLINNRFRFVMIFEKALHVNFAIAVLCCTPKSVVAGVDSSDQTDGLNVGLKTAS